jgi:hypothetical protein
MYGIVFFLSPISNTLFEKGPSRAREERKRFYVLNPKPYHNKHHDAVVTLEEPMVLTRVQPPL